MTIASFLIDPASLWLPWQGDLLPVGIVDLDRVDGASDVPMLPPFPMIGIGSGRPPLAAHLDLLVEPPVAPEALIDSICAMPRAAALIVQLLRHIDGLEVAQALVAESLAYAVLQGSAEHADWLARQVAASPEPDGQVHVMREDDALHILLDRPASRNAITASIRDALREAFELAALDPDIRSVSLRGEGRAFSVGADLAEFGTTRDPAIAHLIRMQTLPAHAIARVADKFAAHVQGACVGSALEMVAFARSLTATADAWFHLPELAMGILPGAGGCVSVSRRIGRQRAALMILSGRRVNAQTALDWGLIDAVVND